MPRVYFHPIVIVSVVLTTWCMTCGCGQKHEVEANSMAGTNATGTAADKAGPATAPNRTSERSPEFAAWYEEQAAEGMALAELSRQERRARWDVSEYGVPPRDGQPIGKYLPDLKVVKSITVTLPDLDSNNVRIEIPQSQWRDLYDLLEDSEPIALGAEILRFGLLEIQTLEGSTFKLSILSHFANPVIFGVLKSERGGMIEFATMRSELEILKFFAKLQSEKDATKLMGWFPMP